MRTRLAYSGVFLAFFLCATAMQWPAAWIAPWIDRASGGQWRLAATSGTVWNGAGILLVRTGNNAAWRNAQSIRWQVRGNELWSGRLAIDTTLEQGAARFVATPGGIASEEFDFTLPATEIASLLPGALGRYGWSGILRAHGAKFGCAWSPQACSGEVELLWNDAAVTEIPGAALGDYRLRLVGEGPVLRVDLTTLRGRLQIAGTGEIADNGQLHFNGEATAKDANAESLNTLLSTLGRPAGSGKYLIEYRETGVSR